MATKRRPIARAWINPATPREPLLATFAPFYHQGHTLAPATLNLIELDQVPIWAPELAGLHRVVRGECLHDRPWGRPVWLVELAGGTTIIRASTDGDATAELQIELTGSKTLSADDFHL